MIGLTTEHGRLLAFIREHVSRFGYAPTVREMMQATGMRSMVKISVALEHLEDYDFIRREPRRSRALEVACSRIPLTACAFVPVQHSGSAVA
jgi:repressor LexA